MQLIIRAGLRPTSKYQNISGTLALEKFRQTYTSRVCECSIPMPSLFHHLLSVRGIDLKYADDILIHTHYMLI